MWDTYTYTNLLITTLVIKLFLYYEYLPYDKVIFMYRYKILFDQNQWISELFFI